MRNKHRSNMFHKVIGVAAFTDIVRSLIIVALAKPDYWPLFVMVYYRQPQIVNKTYSVSVFFWICFSQFFRCECIQHMYMKLKRIQQISSLKSTSLFTCRLYFYINKLLEKTYLYLHTNKYINTMFFPGKLIKMVYPQNENSRTLFVLLLTLLVLVNARPSHLGETNQVSALTLKLPLKKPLNSHCCIIISLISLISEYVNQTLFLLLRI